jgi:hypothetical protein
MNPARRKTECDSSPFGNPLPALSRKALNKLISEFPVYWLKERDGLKRAANSATHCLNGLI